MESTTNAPETHEFRAEIRQLLDIVIHSLYTDREVFIRELISNAADALEKMRHRSLTEENVLDSAEPLQIHIETDENAKTFTIRDTGCGMTRDELVAGLGTIAHSGTKAFLQQLREQGGKSAELIGQFGVGFYSAFMVAKKVTVQTRAYHPDAIGYEWSSTGEGSWDLREMDGLPRGTSITLELREDAGDFAAADTVRRHIRRYSSFVSFPILLAGEQVNTQEAIWLKDPKTLKPEDYHEFYRFLSGTGEEPRYILHFRSDVPLNLNAILFVPKENLELLGLGHLDPGVDLYCRKILIQKHPEELLPKWMRFVRGVVDSEDLPLNISRESMQDTGLLRRIANSLVAKFTRFLNDKADEDPKAWTEFFDRSGPFIKEGIIQDWAHQADLAKLLRFESSKTSPGEPTSLEKYLEGMQPDQKAIYYLCGATRPAIEQGAYIEAFRARDIEVLYTRDAADDFALSQLRTFRDKPLKSGDQGDLDLPPIARPEDALSEDEAKDLCGWMKKTLGERVASVRVSTRLVDKPAMVTMDHDLSATLQRMMGALNRQEAPKTPVCDLEVNPASPLVRQLAALRTRDESLAQEVASQLLDGALLSAGLLMDLTSIMDRMNSMMLRVAAKG